MKSIILYKLVIVSVIAKCCAQLQFPIHPGCSPQYDNLEDTEKCTHTVYCKNYVNEFQFTHNEKCSNIVYSQAHGRNVDPISLVLKDDDVNEIVPEFTYPYNYQIVYSLDIIDSNFRWVPDLYKMPQLAKLKISRCSLNNAKLSNKDELPALVDLDYSENNINYIELVPGEHEYKMLQKLNISHNSLDNITEAIFDLFPNIESLDLSHNFLFTLDILTFEGIRKLLYLNLSNNRITEIDSSLIRLRYLVTLDLSYNMINTLKTSDFTKLANLQELNLDSNAITRIETNLFENMVSLTKIDLRNNQIKYIDKDVFTKTSKLTTVYLSKNKLKALPKNVFQGKVIVNFAIEDNALEGTLERGLFEGLTMVTELDLSFQHLSSVANFAFAGLQYLETLSVNNNEVESLSNYSLKGLQKLKCLDLSHNRIKELDIATDDLISLEILTLHHNQIAHISSDIFVALGSLQLLDVSHNNVSYLEPHSFRSLHNLFNFKISNNPFKDSIEEKTFDGLSSLPSLDISGTLITVVNNGSVTGMIALRYLNVSHSNITELEYNSLSYAGSIEEIDLSFNQLSVFDINTTDLSCLKTLMLDNNMLQVITQTSLNGLSVLNTVGLSHNQIHTIHKNAFDSLDDLRSLDLSYNPDFEFDVSLVKKAKYLAELIISWTKATTSFDINIDIPVARLEMVHSGMQNISRLHLHKLQHLESLVLSNNEVTKLEIGSMSNLTTLKLLDLSYNHINYIQPGTFQDNTNIKMLNMSHNKLTEIDYGIFRGLMHVKTLDISYNKIRSLHRSRFHDIEHLNTLIADYNDIDYISDDEFLGTSTSELSIGGNPIPCEIVASLHKKNYKINIISVSNDIAKSNIHGVTCKNDSYISNSKLFPATVEQSKLFQDLRNILYNLSKVEVHREIIEVKNNDTIYLANMSAQQQKMNQNNLEIINSIKDLNSVSNKTSIINTNTNLLLGKILRVLSSKEFIPTSKPIMISQENISQDNSIIYINKIKQDLEDSLALEKQSALDLDDKIAHLKSKIDSLVANKTPVHEKLRDSDENKSKSIFTEVCVGLILVILISFIIFRVYK